MYNNPEILESLKKVECMSLLTKHTDKFQYPTLAMQVIPRRCKGSSLRHLISQSTLLR